MREFDLAPAGPAPTSDLLIGRSFLLLGSGPVAEALTARLTAHGAHALTAEAPPADGEFDGIVHLVATDAPPVLPDVFPAYQRVLAGNPRWVLAAGASAGLRGFFRSLAREYPDTVARVVEHAPGTAPEDIAAELVAELTAPDREPVVLRSPGTRRGLRMAEEGLGLLGSTGAGPAGDGAAEAAALGLDSDSVVLLVGGARGITARFAATLAAASRCRIELFGRTALSGDGEGRTPPSPPRAPPVNCGPRSSRAGCASPPRSSGRSAGSRPNARCEPPCADSSRSAPRCATAPWTRWTATPCAGP